MRSFFLGVCSVIVAFASSSMAFVHPTTRVASVGISKQCISPSICPPAASVELQLRKIDDDENVNVNLIPDVDAFTLTAVGFGLIAFNFLVLANMGDIGIGGAVARIINTFSD